MSEEGGWIVLRDNTLICEIEQMIAAGKGWSREFDSRVQEVSIALFGVTRSDTEKPCIVSEGAEPDMAVFEQWLQLQADLIVPTNADFCDDDIIEWWAEAGLDVADSNGVPLRCLVNFDRQLLAALHELLPSAALTWDASGTRGPIDAVEWGASLAAEAATFKSAR